jgi:hypothetical protein
MAITKSRAARICEMAEMHEAAVSGGFRIPALAISR